MFTHIPKQKRKKWDAKAESGIFVGYDENVKAYKVLMDKSKKIELHRDVIFVNELEKSQIKIEKDKDYYVKILNLENELSLKNINQNENNIHVENNNNEEIIENVENNQNEQIVEQMQIITMNKLLKTILMNDS